MLVWRPGKTGVDKGLTRSLYWKRFPAQGRMSLRHPVPVPENHLRFGNSVGPGQQDLLSALLYHVGAELAWMAIPLIKNGADSQKFYKESCETVPKTFIN